VPGAVKIRDIPALTFTLLVWEEDRIEVVPPRQRVYRKVQSHRFKKGRRECVARREEPGCLTLFIFRIGYPVHSLCIPFPPTQICGRPVPIRSLQ